MAKSRKKVLLVKCALITAFIFSGCNEDLARSTEKDVLPDTLPGSGSWRIVNFWAIWCSPCRTEIPELNELDLLPHITVLGVNYDGIVGNELTAQSDNMGIKFVVLETDPSPELGIARPKVLPTTFLVNPVGVVKASLVGPQTAQSILEKFEESSESSK